MGACSSADSASAASARGPAGSMPLPPSLLESRNASLNAGGKRLKGRSDEEAFGPRGLQLWALEAAELRQDTAPGLAQGRVAQLQEQLQRSELIGKITEHYTLRRLTIPMGLNMRSVWSLKQLRNHWEQVSLAAGDPIRFIYDIEYTDCTVNSGEIGAVIQVNGVGDVLVKTETHAERLVRRDHLSRIEKLEQEYESCASIPASIPMEPTLCDNIHHKMPPIRERTMAGRYFADGSSPGLAGQSFIASL